MFRSADEAVRWAARVMSTEIVKTSSINRMGGSSRPESSGLTQHDRHAQAALIMQLVERDMDQYEKLFVLAHYFHELRNGPREREVESGLARVVLAGMPSGVHSTRGVSKLVRIYFGIDIGLSAIRADFRCGNDKSMQYRDIAFEILGSIGKRVDAKIETALFCSGLVDDADGVLPVREVELGVA